MSNNTEQKRGRKEGRRSSFMASAEEATLLDAICEDLGGTRRVVMKMLVRAAKENRLDLFSKDEGEKVEQIATFFNEEEEEILAEIGEVTRMKPSEILRLIIRSFSVKKPLLKFEDTK